MLRKSPGASPSTIAAPGSGGALASSARAQRQARAKATPVKAAGTTRPGRRHAPLGRPACSRFGIRSVPRISTAHYPDSRATYREAANGAHLLGGNEALAAAAGLSDNRIDA